MRFHAYVYVSGEHVCRLFARSLGTIHTTRITNDQRGSSIRSLFITHVLTNKSNGMVIDYSLPRLSSSDWATLFRCLSSAYNMSDDLGSSGVHQSTDENNEAESSEPCRRLTFVSHAGEDKPFARSLLKAIERANVAAFFDDDMKMGTSAGEEMMERARTAAQGVVVLSRRFLTKKWPMKEVNLFVENDVRIHPLYYKVTPDELSEIVHVYDRYGLFPITCALCGWW